MTITITVETKVIGGSKPMEPGWDVFINQLQLKYSLADLISSIVQNEVNSFNQETRNNRLSPIFPFEIEAGRATGKIDSLDKSRREMVEPEKAVEIALKAFNNGHYYVFVDDIQINKLNDEVILKPNSKIVFIRLIPLIGG